MLSLIGDPRQLCACSRCTGKPKLAPGASDAAAISYVPSVGAGWLDLVQSFLIIFIFYFLFLTGQYLSSCLFPPAGCKHYVCVCVCIWKCFHCGCCLHEMHLAEQISADRLTSLFFTCMFREAAFHNNLHRVFPEVRTMAKVMPQGVVQTQQ